MPKTYRVDQSAVRKLTRRDPEAERESSQQHGFYQYHVYEVVPLSKIHPEKVWKEVKLQRVQEDIVKGRPLAPIEVVEKGSRYFIRDGIHRYNASVKDPSITHIPVVKQVTVQTPELLHSMQGTEKLSPGTWVKINQPSKWGLSSPWAVVVEHLHQREDRGATRHRYSLAGFEDGEAEMVGDFNDDAFEVVGKPSTDLRSPMQDLFSDYGMSIRVARRWLSS